MVPVKRLSLGLSIKKVTTETPLPVKVPVSRLSLGLHMRRVSADPVPIALQVPVKRLKLGLHLHRVSIKALSGSEVSLPAFRPNAGTPVRLRIGWLTDVLTARSTKEQRRQLRLHPTGSMIWETNSFDVEAQAMAAFLYSGQPNAQAIPLWPFVRRTAAAVDAGETTIPLEPGAGTFWLGRSAAFLNQDSPSEVRTLAAIHADDLELAEPLVNAWPAGTEVYPVAPGYLKSTQPMSWESLGNSATQLTVDIPTFGAVERTYPAVPSWLGVEVLDVQPNRSGPVEDGFDRAQEALESRTGPLWMDPGSDAPALERPFVWTALGAAEVIQLLRFLEARRGAAVPFFVPSWQQDLRLETSAAANAGQIRIRACKYTDGLFNHGLGRRTLAVRLPGGTSWSYHVVTEAVNEGSYETLTIIPYAPAAWAKETTLISFLRMCRLADDEVELVCHNPAVIEATIPIREVSLENPTEMPGWGPRARVTQEALEVLRTGRGFARVTQAAVEVLRTGRGSARVSQLALEVLRTN
jgi:hypothetical protein